jgi:hypothetical protein
MATSWVLAKTGDDKAMLPTRKLVSIAKALNIRSDAGMVSAPLVIGDGWFYGSWNPQV